MSHFVRIRVVSWVALLLAIAASHCHVWAQDGVSQATANEGQEQVLVLQDGGVLTGRIARQGENYLVKRAGGQIQVSAANALLICGSLQEAYDNRRQQLTHPTAEGHLVLAEWCLRHDLITQARREWTDAQSLDARHPRLALVERRLAHASQDPRKPAVSAPAAESPATLVKTSESLRAAPVDVSDRVVERFTRKVQPVLVNNCTASGCHQTGGAKPFQLDRALLHGLANRRSTMSNLAATLALVDRDQPQFSPLLTVPRRAHAGMDNPIFGPRQEQAYRHLVDWVALVTGSDSSRSQAPTGPETDLLATETTAAHFDPPVTDTTQPPSDSAATASGGSNEVEPAFESGAEMAIGVVQTNYEEHAAGLSPATQRPRFGAQVEKWQPRDPFDAEIFNRQQLERRRSTDTQDTASQQENG